MTLDFSDKVAVITGGGSGLGEATAHRLVASGAKVVLVDIDDESLAKVKKKLGENNVLSVNADISDDAAMRGVYKQTEERFGRLDVVFANAGINGVWAPLEELGVDEWRKTIDNNLTGTFLTVKHAVPLLKKRGGSVIITASVNGTRIFSNTGATAYSSSKAGQLGFMKMIALELAQYKIRVNAICPGSIQTQINETTEARDIEKVKEPVEYPEGSIPLTDGDPGNSEQVANLVAFLASDAASHISGTPLWIDGAESLLQG